MARSRTAQVGGRRLELAPEGFAEMAVIGIAQRQRQRAQVGFTTQNAFQAVAQTKIVAVLVHRHAGLPAEHATEMIRRHVKTSCNIIQGQGLMKTCGE